MGLPLPFAQPAAPPGRRIVAPMPSQRAVYLIDQAHGEIRVPFFPGDARPAEEVAHRQ